MVINDMNQIEAVVYDKVRVYYRTDKKLGGLIKTFVEVRTDRLSRTVGIYAPFLEREDIVKINGVTYVPKEQS